MSAEAIAAAFDSIAAEGFSGAVAVSRNGRILYSLGAGLAGPEVQFTPDVAIDIASIAKPVTSMAIQKLVQKGKVSLEDNLSKWFPDAPREKRAVTVRQLLRHTSGIIDIPPDVQELTKIAAEEMAAKLLNAPLTHTPGTKRSYSNGGYTLLALIVERASEQDFFSFLQEEIFEAAGVTASYDPEAFPERKVAQTLVDREWRDKRSEAALRNGPFWGLWGAGGLYMSAPELARLVDAFAAGRIVPMHLVEQAWAVTPDGTKGAGLGWGVRPSADEIRVGHLGASDHSTTLLEHYRKRGVTLVILSNQKNADVLLVQKKIEPALLDGER